MNRTSKSAMSSGEQMEERREIREVILNACAM